MGKHSNQVRIIAGQWRGRKLEFPDIQGLRPTSDRVRETLFNWLAPIISGSSCLDLFAGSGALGFEAASRGASRVVMVDLDRKVVETLERMRQKLAADAIELVCARAEDYLAGADQRFDIIFLDPPFADGKQLAAAIGTIEAGSVLKPGGLLYLETPKGAEPLHLPASLQIYRRKSAGQVDYQLLSYYPDKRENPESE